MSAPGEETPGDSGPTSAAAGVAQMSLGEESAADAPVPAYPSLDPPEAPSAVAEDLGAQESGPAKVSINGKSYDPLADGDYDAIVLSTGLEECVLAGLLAVRGMRVLQIDRNPYYGGACASLNLQELYQKHQKSFNQQMEQRFGRSREFCIDQVPKLLMANGKLVKMLIQTGVTRYIDFNGIAGSYVFNSGKIYRLPITPTEALTSSLVSLFQKNALRKFAEYIKTYHAPPRVAGTLSRNEFKEAIISYYKVHNKEKLGEVDALIDRFDTQRELLVSALEKKYGIPVFPATHTVEFGPGSLCLRIEGKPVKKGVPPDQGGPIKSAVMVTSFLPGPSGAHGPAEKSGKVAVGDIIQAVNGESVLGMSDQEVQQQILAAPRPMKITFMKPVFDTSKQKYDLLKMTTQQLFNEFGLNETTANFIGHCMALHTSDDYLSEPAEPTIRAVHLYAKSVGRFGQDSPYLYSMYGLSSLPEGFSRLAAIYGGVVMLRTDPSEILKDPSTGEAVGVRVGNQAAKAKMVIGDHSYFPQEMSQKVGQVIRSICILKKPIRGTHGDSAQIILPAKHLMGKKNDVYISVLGPSLRVSPKGTLLAIASTKVETSNPEAELRQAYELMGDIEDKFVSVTDTFAPVADGTKDKCLITKSLDETSHFETAAKDIMSIYRRIFGKELNLDEKIVEDPNEQQ